MKYFAILIFACHFIGISQVSDFSHIDFSKAKNRATLLHGRSIKNLPILAYNLTSDLKTDAEKFRAIFLWVCQNINIDAEQGDKVLNKRRKFRNDSLAFIQWNKKYLHKTFKRLFNKKKTMCSGYAYLIKELCFLTNIECEIIDGYARTATSNIDKLNFINHSWNAVKLDEKWYLCDAIWASGYVSNGNYIKDYNDGYFLADPILFGKNHIPIDKKWFLNSTLELNKFNAEPIVYGETFKHQIIPISPKQLLTTVKKGESITFNFKTLINNFDKKVELVQYYGDQEIKYKITNLNTENNKTTFNTSLKYKGHYDLHLKVDNEIVASYTFSVVK